MLLTKQCRHCRHPLPDHAYRQKYCSPSHRAQYYARRRLARVQRDGPEAFIRRELAKPAQNPMIRDSEIVDMVPAARVGVLRARLDYVVGLSEEAARIKDFAARLRKAAKKQSKDAGKVRHHDDERREIEQTAKKQR